MRNKINPDEKVVTQMHAMAVKKMSSFFINGSNSVF